MTDELGCDNLVVSVRDKRYESDGEACYKIFRTYDVINWCEYDGISDPIIVPGMRIATASPAIRISLGDRPAQ